MTFSDIFKSNFLANMTSVTILDMFLALALSFAIGLFIFLIYKKTYAGVMYSSSFGVTLMFNFEGLDRRELRYCLLHSPNCTKIGMAAINENELFRQLGCFAHESEEKVDFSEPFGAILWHKRVNTGYPLCAASALVGLSMENLIRLELGRALPDKDTGEQTSPGIMDKRGRPFFQVAKRIPDVMAHKGFPGICE